MYRWAMTLRSGTDMGHLGAEPPRKSASLLMAAACVFACSCILGEIGDPDDDDDVTGDASTIDAPPGAPDARPQPQPDAQPPDAAPVPDAAPCVGGELNVVDPATGACYMYFTAEVPWDIALAACASLDPPGHLATSTAPAENDILAELGPTSADHIWLGGNDQDTEGTWVWLTDEDMIFENWADGEPNDSGGEDCMIMRMNEGGTWDDRDCDNAYHYYCERE
jgi:C-type mannose receptor